MKPVHALIACSLLGSVWLASCSSDNKKKVAGTGGEAGEAGEPSGGTGAVGGKGGQPSAGTGGAATGGASTAGEPDQTGGASPGGQAAQGGEGGAPAPLACFGDLNDAAAGAHGLGEAGAGNTHHVVYDCQTLVDAFNPSFDPSTGNVTLDASRLGPVASGDFTFYYDYDDAGGISASNTCGDASVQVNGTQLVLPISKTHTVTSVRIPLLQLRDQCGGDTTLPTADIAGDCQNLTFTGEGNGDGGIVWAVDCFEGSCDTTCADHPT